MNVNELNAQVHKVLAAVQTIEGLDDKGMATKLGVPRGRYRMHRDETSRPIDLATLSGYATALGVEVWELLDPASGYAKRITRKASGEPAKKPKPKAKPKASKTEPVDNVFDVFVKAA